MKKTLVVEEAVDGELYIQLPDDLLESMGWDDNTELMWTVHDDGKIELRKNNHEN